MIKYKLVCKDCDNSFDSWFSSSKEYEKLKKKKFLNCHICDSLKVEKTLMMPSIVKSKNIISKDNIKFKNIKKTLTKYQKFIEKNFNYVGKNFTYEARLAHYKNKKLKKGIYGFATKEELNELKEEGIDTTIIPWMNNKNN